MKPLPPSFYDRDTLSVARDLLGKYLVRRLGETWLAVRLTETEAYVGRCDKACHAYAYRRTARTETLFAAPGTAYVYLIYGIHCCLNAVTEPEGEPCAVLIRGAEPAAGHDLLAQRRFGVPFEKLTLSRRRNLLNGPGKLCQGLGIDRTLDGAPLSRPGFLITEAVPELGLPPHPANPADIQATPRIGIDTAEEARDFPWRFLLQPREASIFGTAPGAPRTRGGSTSR